MREAGTGPSVPLWETQALRAVAGDTLRPGGFALTDRAAERIGLRPGWRVLDVGCGLGATVARLRGRYGASAWGVEPSAGQLARAGQAAPMAGLVRARGDALPFASDSLDAVFCECVLSLLDDPAQGLHEFHRVLRPGGFLVLSDLCASRPPVSDGSLEPSSCAARAVPQDATRELIASTGFAVQLVEDHSRHLRELAAGLVFMGECPESRNEALSCGCGGAGRTGLGYYLMIAQKQGATHA